MKKNVLFLILLFLFKSAFGQDSTQITFTEEPDTLVKQRFIDRYENVFMTKMPSRHMFKLNMSFNPANAQDFNPIDIQHLTYEVGYEYKVLPAFSIGLNVAGTNPYYFDNGRFRGILSGNVQLRWYYDMKKRIREGKNANNFSGNFIGAVVEKRLRYDWEKTTLLSIGIEFGFQRRFLNHGRVEFGVGIFYQQYADGFFEDEGFTTGRNVSDFIITTRTNLGLAFGDWKRAKRIPLCDIINCERFVGHQLKVLWPKVSIGNRLIKGTMGISYEKKIAKSPVSINLQIFADYRKLTYLNSLIIDQTNFFNSSYQIQPSIQIRYYYLQKRNMRRGTGGNNLSGLYAGPYSDYVSFSDAKFRIKSNKELLGVGFIAGYQKTLLKNAYVDIFGAQSWNILPDGPGRPSLLRSARIGFGLAF